MRKKWGLLALPLVLISSCQLLGTGPRVKFVNSTSSQVVSSLSFGAAGFQGPLIPGQSTGYFPITIGLNDFNATRQDGTAVATIQFNIAVAGDYAVILSDYYQTFVTLTSFPQNDTVTVSGVMFTASNLSNPSPPLFSVAGTDSQALASLNVCVAELVPGVFAGGTFFSSTTAPVIVTSNGPAGTCVTSQSYTMTVSFKAD